MNYLISTACDQKYEDFLINDWLKSLMENSNLSDTDILVLDFGLSEKARKILTKHGTILVKATTPGKIVNTRFIELHNFLKINTQYEQVLMCDSGDMIFQGDISNLFKLYPNTFRAVCEDYKVPMDVFLMNTNLSGWLKKEIRKILNEKKMINMGLLIGPREKFVEMCNFVISNMTDLNTWGMDQLLTNYYLYKNGFVELDKSYNFIPTTHLGGFFIKNSVFYFKNGQKIIVVHNAGNKRLFRPIRNFGYGHAKNKPKYLMIYLLRASYSVVNFFRR